MTMSSKQIAQCLNRYSPLQWKQLMDALYLSPEPLSRLKLERWMADSTEFQLSAQVLEFLEDWVLGRFGMCSTSDKFFRIKVRSAAAVCLGPRLPPITRNTSDFGNPAEGDVRTAGPMKLVAAAKRGAELPSPSDLERAAVARQEAAEQAAAVVKRAGIGKRLVATIPLWPGRV